MGCSENDYDYLRAVVLMESANVIAPSRNAQFDCRLAPLAQSAGALTLEHLVDMLRVDRKTQLHRAVAEAMTINETSFFRDKSSFDALAEVILPRLIECNRPERTLRIWSAASSTGQEAYSIAMLLCERFPELAGWNLTLLGTDLSRRAVEYAQEGRYGRLEVNRGLPARMLLKYFEQKGDQWEITPKLRAMCSFRTMNLCAPAPALPRFDLILLRNVLLYFSARDRSTVLCGVRQHMVDGGYLLLGAAEQAEDSTELFRAEFAQDCYFYRPVTAGP